MHVWLGRQVEGDEAEEMGRARSYRLLCCSRVGIGKPLQGLNREDT